MTSRVELTWPLFKNRISKLPENLPPLLPELSLPANNSGRDRRNKGDELSAIIASVLPNRLPVDPDSATDGKITKALIYH